MQDMHQMQYAKNHPRKRRTQRGAAGWIAALASAALLASGGWAGTASAQATDTPSAAAPAASAPPPVERFFPQPGFGSAKLSPDGRSVAFLARGPEGLRQLAVLDLDTLKPAVIAAVPERDIRGFVWVNSRRLVYWLHVRLTGPNRTDEGPGLFALDKDGQRFRVLQSTVASFVEAPNEGVALVDWRWYLEDTVPGGQSDEVIVAKAGEVSRERVGYFEVQRLNTVTGHVRDVETPLHSHEWVFDTQARVVAASTRSGGEATLQLRQPDGPFTTAARFPELGDGSGAVWPLAQAADGQLLVTAPHGPTMALWSFDTAAGRLPAQPLMTAPGFDLHPQPVLTSKGLAGVRVQVEAEVTQWLDPALKALQEAIDRRLPQTSNRVSVPYFGDSPWVLVEAQSDRHAPAAYVYNRSTQRVLRVGETRPGLDPARLGRMQFERIPARDGLPIPTYLTLPAGSSPQQPPPMVVLVHGGPWVRGQVWSFDPEVQLLASRGYAVLQPEFRGSTGFGWQHFHAGWKQWGRAMQDDITDTVRWAIRQGHADPKRICIAGASYGGYAALMGLVREPELFRCAINWVGVTDPTLLLETRWSDLTREFKTYGAQRLIGDPSKDAELFRQISPLHQAERIKAPVLMAYGAWDERVPIIHGERMRDALAKHNTPVEWVVYREEGHSWRKPETHWDFWKRVESFLGKHLK